jgi:hypothetical protein
MSDNKRGISAASIENLVTERRSLLKWSGLGIVGLMAFSSNIPGFDMSKAFAETAAATGKAVDLGEGDVGVLNYAYALEQLEAAFYTQVAKTPYANMDSADKDILTGIRDHEIAHRDFFKAALKKNAIPALAVDFSKIDFNSRDSVLTTAQTFENLGVAAYNGAGQLLKKEEYLLLAGKIVSVEARHAAAIGYLLNSKRQAKASTGTGTGTTVGQGSGSSANTAVAAPSVVNDKGLDQALAPSAVLAAAGPYVKTPVTADDIG